MARVLVADDEYLLAAFLEDLLVDEGYDILLAGDGVAALAVAREFKPDLIVTDFMMPGLTGVELATALREDAELQRIPVILVSGAQGALARSRPDLFVAVFDKPYVISILLSEIRRVLPGLGSGDE